MKKNLKNYLIEDWRRVNVAFTRAKKKLIVIGSLKELIEINNLNKFIKHIKQVFNLCCIILE